MARYVNKPLCLTSSHSKWPGHWQVAFWDFKDRHI
jgi:endo-alpha-1,4-polygalactosaminidase (GH114 family)